MLTGYFFFCTFARSNGRAANESVLTLARVAARQVVADGVRTARVREALVDVDTRGSHGVEPLAADAFFVDAFRVQCAIVVACAQRPHRDLFCAKTSHVNISSQLSLKHNSLIKNKNLFLLDLIYSSNISIFNFKLSTFITIQLTNGGF
jgi:hypothetical protein